MENTARGVLLRAAAAAPRAVSAFADAGNPLVRPIIAAQARKQVAKRARREHYPAPYAILDIWVKHDGDALAAPPSDPASIAHLLQTPTAANLIRVFKLQERLKSFGRDSDALTPAPLPVVEGKKMSRCATLLVRRIRARRRRRHDGRRHRGVVRAARAHRHAAGPERRAARAGDRDAPRSSSPSG